MTSSVVGARPRAATSLKARRQVRLGPFLPSSEAEAVVDPLRAPSDTGRNEAEAAPGVLRAPNDNDTESPRCALGRALKPIGALAASSEVGASSTRP